MLGNYSFTRYIDNYFLSNSDTLSVLNYVLLQNINCNTSTKTISSGTIPINTSSIQIIIPEDGDYQLVLTRGSDTATVIIRNYLNLQRSLILSLKQAICNLGRTCKDCERQGLDDCVDYQGIFSQIIGYQYLIKPYTINYCLEGDIISSFISQAIAQNQCVITQELMAQLYNEAMIGKIINTKKTIIYLATIYYLVFYFYEKLLAADSIESAYIDTKFYFSQVQFCIGQCGVNIPSLQSLFTSIVANNNQPPTVGNVTRRFTYTSGLQVYTFSEADFTNNFGDPNGYQPNIVILLNNAFNGVLYYQGVLINGEGFTFPINNANQLQYKYTPTMTNHIYEKLFFQINDTNPTPKYSNMATFTLDVNAYVNQPPSSVGNNTITMGNRVDRTFTLADFTSSTTPAYADPENDGVYQLRIDSLPTLGALKLSGTPCTSGQIINASDIVAGNFVYDAPNQDAAASVSFNFSLSDTGSHTFVS